MTKKDYILLAGSLKRVPGINKDQLKEIADTLGVVLKRDNPNFSYEKFWDAIMS